MLRLLQIKNILLFSSTLKESPPSNGMIIPFTLAQKIKPYAQWTRDRCSPLNNFLEIIPRNMWC